MDAGTAKKLIEKNLTYDEVKRLTVKLVQHASPQTHLLESEPQVLSLIRDVIKAELEQSGLKPAIDRMGNLILHVKGKTRNDRLMLVGYAMCAAPSTMQNPYSGEIVDGAPYKLHGECVWGRGACEQKGSLAAMMAAMKCVGGGKVELPSDLYFIVSTAGETGRHDSLAFVLDHGGVETDWCIIDGPPEIQLGNKGRVDILVTVKGKQAHSSRPWEGINAIDGAMKVLEKLKPLMPYPEARTHSDLGKVSLTPNAIESFPKATHTIQNECRVMFDRRLLPGDDPRNAIKQMKDAIGKIEPFEIEVAPRDFMYPSEVGKDAEVVRSLEHGIRTMLGYEPKFTFSTAANDTGLFNFRGIQAINYGSRDIRFQHTDHDLVPVGNVFNAAKVFAFLAIHR
ncbi:MAG TPA: M20/M25/M40 family metallo-hydrolase [Candidatus Binatia bacterium]|jgi:acetylornithine deacetylase/succinyl-diaminopimelate desuccinylase-like protein|nr:M20/M25/M40 family metallo-hydrolase [Candidatus Binatia bacterium]